MKDVCANKQHAQNYNNNYIRKNNRNTKDITQTNTKTTITEQQTTKTQIQRYTTKCKRAKRKEWQKQGQRLCNTKNNDEVKQYVRKRRQQ